MPLSLNEIRKRAHAFSLEWADASNEEADAKEFLIQFLEIFGVTRRRVATFEHRVKKLDDGDGYIDLLWKGMLLVEMKSRGKDLTKAYQQAKDYCHGLKEHELPKLILISDFQRFQVYDENGQQTSFALAELASHLHLFDCMRGLERRTITEEDPVNLQAAELMGQLHDKLKAIGYDGHALELYLVRLLFLLFADDTGIFDRGSLYDYLRNNTREDGSDLAMHLASIFDVVNRPPEKRLKNLDEELARFPYINGKLFEEQLPPASFDSDMRHMLLKASQLDWGKISPAIFGSLFQSVMDPKARRNLGAHYTSEKNILKLIGPLFLDELKTEYQQKRNNKNELRRLHARMADLRFLDPACGCGNFLLITYREMRLLEMDIVNDLLQGQTVTDVGSYFLLDVDKYYGIEYEEFPAQIAQVAMWLMDHQMNLLASQRFGDYYVRLPLRKSATIRHGNALRIDWQSLLAPASTVTLKAETANVFMVEEPPGEYQTLNVYARNINLNPAAPSPDTDLRFDYIMGNPPFIGKHLQSESQKEDLEMVFRGIKNHGSLDYVACWFYLAAKLMSKNQRDGKTTSTAFVSTNSISQGEQVGILWEELLSTFKCSINFAYQTFSWGNEAKGSAAVHVVIIGFSTISSIKKTLYTKPNSFGSSSIQIVKNISPYLVEGSNVSIQRRTTPVCNVPPMIWETSL